MTARQVESARSWLSSYLSSCEVGLRRSRALQRVRSSEMVKPDRGILLDV